MSEEKILSPFADKSFIIAKAIVEVNNKDKILVECRPDCSIYIADDNGFNKASKYESTAYEEINLSIKRKSIWDAFVKDKDGESHKSKKPLTVYWIKNNIIIDVPFGYGKENELRYHGQVKVKISDPDTFLINYPDLIWQYMRKDGISYEYLLDYFIDCDDKEKKQKGVSINLRSKIIEQINSNVTKTYSESICDATEFIKEAISKIDLQYGMQILNDSISVKLKEVGA